MMETLNLLLAGKEEYDNAGGVGGGALVCLIILWLLFGGSGDSKK